LRADDTPRDPEGLSAVLSKILYASLDFSAAYSDSVCHCAFHIAGHTAEAKGLYDEDATQTILDLLGHTVCSLSRAAEGLSPETIVRLEAIKNTRR
jgi:hypothetical protein